MKLSTLSKDEIERRLTGAGLLLSIGPFLSQVRSSIPAVIDGIALLYADCRLPRCEDFADFHIALTQPFGARRWLRPQVRFEFDGISPFKPLPLAQALPLLEWSLNWCIANHAHQYLIIHAAVIEKGDRAAILPGAPGSGKSTLTAYLVHNGWRLLSDELALLSLDDGRATPLARPISLKNESIDVIGGIVPGANMTCRCEDTVKGTVALLKAPSESVARIPEKVQPAWVIFPRFKQGAATSLKPRSKADTLIEVGNNAFNYSIHGKRGFEILSRLMDDCACFDLTYSDLTEARLMFEALEPVETLAHEASV